MKERPNGIRARPALDAQKRVQAAIRPSHFGVGETLSACDHTENESDQRVSQRDRVGTGQVPGQMLLKLVNQAALLQEGNETDQSTKGSDSAWSL